MKTWGNEEVDVCIVGSGAGGGTLAYELARQGARVVVLERGPWLKEKDFLHDEIATVRRNFWVPYVTDEPHVLVADGGKPHKTPEGWVAHCVGGGTVHMTGFFYRLHPDDFRLGTRYGKLEGADVADWPISYDDLAPFYDRVEKEIGVSGTAGGHPFEPPRKGPYPLEAIEHSQLAVLVDAGCKKLGYHGFVTPRAVISRDYRGRAGCVYCAFCGSYGCETASKSSVLATYVQMAVATERCEIRARSMAYEVTVGTDGRARSVRYIDAEGARHEQRAKVVVLAATAVETARLMLNSTSTAFPDGLANGNGLVGRNLTFSTFGNAWGQFDRAKLPEKMRRDDGMPFLGRSVRDFYFVAEKKGGYDKGGTLNYILPHKNPIWTAERLSRRGRPALWGEALRSELHRFHHDIWELELELFGEFLPTPKTYVVVDPEVKDRHGLPVARMHVENHPLAKELSRHVTRKGVDVFAAAGAVKTGIDTLDGTTYHLQQGTCRFGKDPKTSVLDPSCRAHEVENLYVVDGSFMPTSGGAPNTFTIMANALRVGGLLGKRLGRG